MKERIKHWLLSTTTPEMRRDVKDFYKLDRDFLIQFVEKAGAAHILNKMLDFHLSYKGSQSSPQGTVHVMSIALQQDKRTIYEEHYTVT